MPVMPQNPLAALSDTHPDLEVWFDSSPLILDAWKAEVMEKVEGTPKAVRCRERLDGVWDVLVGCTTNPPLTAQAVEYDPGTWATRLKELTGGQSADAGEAMWKLYEHVVQEGADQFKPLFEKSGNKLGYLSGQVDPRELTNTAAMVAMGVGLHAMNPNVMIKMPGVKEGIHGITLLTALGIPTNATLVFTISQIVAVAEAVKKGLELARAADVDLSNWRSVCTMMLGRFEDHVAYDDSAKSVGVELTDELRRWSGPAIFNQAVSLYAERGYESKMLAASMRLGPELDGKTRIWHLEKICAQPVVLTIFPNIIEGWLEHYDGEALPSAAATVPDEVLETLLKIPYFKEGYEEGQDPESFKDHPAVVATGDSFAEATDGLERWVKEQLA
jgi:transaldolase